MTIFVPVAPKPTSKDAVVPDFGFETAAFDHDHDIGDGVALVRDHTAEVEVGRLLVTARGVRRRRGSVRAGR